MNPNPWLTKLVLLATTLTLSGLPAMAQAAAAPQDQQQAAPVPDPASGRVDPTAGPKTPVSSSDVPDAPSTQAAPAHQAQPPAAPSASSGHPQTSQEPLGTATAERGTTAGGPASKPAGMAIAPAKQKQTRSLLIKVGALVAAGAALGIVYGLSHSTPATPPGSGTASNK